MPERAATISSLERMLHLRRFPAFEGLPNVAVAALAENARERSFAKGARLFREGEPMSAIHFILDGHVRVLRAGGEIARAGAGTPLGGLGILARDPRGAECVAESDTFTLELDADALIEVCEDHFVVVHEMLQYLSRWVIEVEKRSGPQARPAGPIPPLHGPGEELDLVDRIFFLRRMAPFARSSINALAELSRGLTEVRFEPGVQLWKEGDASPYALLVVEGEIACASPSHGHRFQVGPGWGLGVMEAVAEVPRWYDATTETRVVALHGAIEGMIDLFEDNFEMAMDYLAVLARGLLDYMERAGPRGELTVVP